MTATRDRIYQTSDLTGAARREFIDDARHGRAYLRTPEGESLVMLRAADLDLLSELRDAFVTYVMLDSALKRDRAQRRPAEFGPWAFIEVFEDDAIEEFRDEMNDALVRATASHDASVIESTLAEWRRSARAYANPVTRALLTARDDSDFVDADEPVHSA